jgi:hypothetical protein
MNTFIPVKLTDEQQERLEEVVFDREFNPKHEDDYFNAGGFYGHWTCYTEDEQMGLIEQAKGKA